MKRDWMETKCQKWLSQSLFAEWKCMSKHHSLHARILGLQREAKELFGEDHQLVSQTIEFLQRDSILQLHKLRPQM